MKDSSKHKKESSLEQGASRWLDVRFWLPIVLSLSAVILSGLQWTEAHRQRSFSARPLVDFVLENDPDDAPLIGLAIKNNGPAPAILDTVTFYVDNKIAKSIDQVAESGNLDRRIIRSEGYKEGDSIGVGMPNGYLRAPQKIMTA